MKKIKTVVIVLLILLLLGFLYFTVSQIVNYLVVTKNTDVLVVTTKDLKPMDQNALFNAVQSWRTDNGYARYSHDPLLCGIAEMRSIEVVTTWGHGSNADRGFNMILSNSDFKFVGENLSKDSDEVERVLDSWLNSPTHKANLVDKSFTHSCIRCTDNYCVQIFAGF